MKAEVEQASSYSRGMRVAAFWQVRDPGNAGTVIRAADAAGCDVVVFVDDCVDMLDPKVDPLHHRIAVPYSRNRHGHQ